MSVGLMYTDQCILEIKCPQIAVVLSCLQECTTPIHSYIYFCALSIVMCVDWSLPGYDKNTLWNQRRNL